MVHNITALESDFEVYKLLDAWWFVRAVGIGSVQSC